MRYYAHSLKERSESEWEPLERHLAEVAERAERFASAFEAGTWGRLVGLWHDLGKYSEAFQNYIRRAGTLEASSQEGPGRVDHSTAGAQEADKRLGATGRLLAHVLAGHHAGLPDTVDEVGGRSDLKNRLVKTVEPLAAEADSFLDQSCPALPKLDFDRNDPSRSAFQIGFLCRMIFSALVDADFLCTEAFMEPAKAAERGRDLPPMAAIRERIDCHLDNLQRKARKTEVNRIRGDVLRQCLDAARLEPGLFSLAVPTGGGKTLSSLAFAAHHASRHELDRIVYAIPFTSIIEQNARAIAKALGDLASSVIEHHSNRDLDEATPWERLAQENWDARVVLTTNVQFFESLFASRTSRCRKLHRIARSVVILDEAQVLPVELLAPTLSALRELVRNYRCSVVLCTATQPALHRRDDFPIGLDGVRPIIADPFPLYRDLKRVEVDAAGTLEEDELASRVADESQALCIVNTRRQAAQLFIEMTKRVEPDSCFHLSATMCPQHRSVMLWLIRRRLASHRPCRVISTQLVEAGVDVDFPVVFRAMAGLDSIAQAAGRCNREGLLSRGRVVVFEQPASAGRAPHFVRQAADDARQVMPDHADVLSPEGVEAYFRLHFWKKGGEGGSGWDKCDVLECFQTAGKHLQFRRAAERYRMIRDEQRSVVIPYGSRGRRLVQAFRDTVHPDRDLARRIQRYAVGIHSRQCQELLDAGLLEECHGRYLLVKEDAYDSRLGLQPGDADLVETLYV